MHVVWRRYKALMDDLQLYLCTVTPKAIQYHKLIRLFAYVNVRTCVACGGIAVALFARNE